MVTANPCRAMHPTHRGVYCEGPVGHAGDHHNLTDKALPVRAQQWAQAPTRIPAALLEEPDAHRRPPRLKVNLRCIAGQHDTCPGHTYGATSLCGCPDPSHAAAVIGQEVQRAAEYAWATSGADIAGDLAAAKAAVEAADDGLGFDVMPPAPEVVSADEFRRRSGLCRCAVPDAPSDTQARAQGVDPTGKARICFACKLPVNLVPVPPVELTAVEVKLITAAHLELRPTSALEAVRRILTDRLAQ